MKRRVLKTLLCMSITTTMLLGETAAILAETVEPEQIVQEESAGAADMEKAALDGTRAALPIEAVEGKEKGEKIVSAHTLADVTGLAYDEATRVLSWNKVPGATRYKVEVVDAAGKVVRSGSTSAPYWRISDYDDDYYLQTGVAYTIRVTATNWEELYQVAADVTWEQLDTLEYDRSESKRVETPTGTQTLYTAYKYPASVNPALLSTVLVTDRSTSVTALSGMSVETVTEDAVYFKVTPNVLQPGEEVKYTFANNAAYRNSDEEGLFSEQWWARTSAGMLDSEDIRVSLGYFEPGETIYIKAQVYNPNYAYGKFPGQTSENCYSAEVSATYKVPAAKLDNVNLVVTNNSIELRPSTSATVTGFQYQRKNGKKWEDLAQQGNNYTDAGLKADTKYTYRVRGYSYDKDTKKTSYTAWKSVSATTWGAALDLHASAASAKSVKLTWNKVPGAEGYEIYRLDTDSYSKTVKNGVGAESFENATLIKTIKKAKTVKYTDKKLTKGSNYQYLVRAYRTIGKNKYYIQSSDDVTLSEENGLRGCHTYYNGKGQLIVKWNKMTGISGYKVEKEDARTGIYVPYKTLKKSAVSITLPKVAAGAESVQYRIRPYKGKNVYGGTSVDVYPQLAVVKGVKAVQTAEGIKVTWNKVSGADYYRVYRAKKDVVRYNQNTKTYELPSGAAVYDVNYTDTSAGISLAPTEAPKTVTNTFYSSMRMYISEDNVMQDEYGRYYMDGTTRYPVYLDGEDYYYIKSDANDVTYTVYTYADALENAVDGNGRFYDSISSYETREITGTSVVDKTVTVKSLVDKSEDPNYKKETDPEYYKNVNGYYYSGANTFAKYQKNPDGSLKVKETVVNEGPEVGNEYYYFVVAYAKPSNGAGANSTVTASVGVTKGAKVTYTNVKAAKDTKVSSVKSKKKATVTLKIKKASGAKGYAIYRSTKKKGTYVKVGATTGTSYTDKNVTAGKTYYYKVASYKKSENGTFIYSKLSAAKKVKAKK